MSREVSRRYEDPLDRVWITAASRVGLEIARTPDAFATTDGRGTLSIGEPRSLDADDCLAQIIFHELCHSLIEGPDSFEVPDWGLDNVDLERDLPREHACLRAQAWLASRHGLRTVLAPTTDHRAFFDALGPDPLAADDPSVLLARIGIARAARPPWAPHLARALAATARIVEEASSWAQPPSLFASIEAPRAAHPAGGWVHPDSSGRCGACAWAEGGLSCVVREASVDGGWPACEAYVASLDCGTCGACCREGFHVVEVAAADPFVAKHGSSLERVDGHLQLPRVDGRCPPLRGDGRDVPYACAVYEDRPISCREFARGGSSCLIARRRVGLSG